MHSPDEQVSSAPQACPHSPQFAASFEVSTHVDVPFAVQQSYPDGQPANSLQVQCPFTQLPDGQGTPQSPQFAASLEVSTHALSQQVGVPAGQTFPQKPQLLSS